LQEVCAHGIFRSLSPEYLDRFNEPWFPNPKIDMANTRESLEIRWFTGSVWVYERRHCEILEQEWSRWKARLMLLCISCVFRRALLKCRRRMVSFSTQSRGSASEGSPISSPCTRRPTPVRSRLCSPSEAPIGIETTSSALCRSVNVSSTISPTRLDDRVPQDIASLTRCRATHSLTSNFL